MLQSTKRKIAKEVIILSGFILAIGILYACSYFYELHFARVYWKGGVKQQDFYSLHFASITGCMLAVLIYPVRLIIYAIIWSINIQRHSNS